MNKVYLVSAAGGYRIVTETHYPLTEVFYFNSYRKAVEWAQNYVTSFSGYTLVVDKELL